MKRIIYELQAELEKLCPLVEWQVRDSDLLKMIVICGAVNVNWNIFSVTKHVPYDEVFNLHNRLPRIVINELVEDIVKAIVSYRRIESWVR